MRRASGVVAPWRLSVRGQPVEVAVDGPLVVNDFPTMLGAALVGVGLAQLPRPVAAADLPEGRLEEVLGDVASTSPGVFIYHSGRRQVLPKLRAFIDRVRGNAGGSPSWPQGRFQAASVSIDAGAAPADPRSV